MQLRDRRRARHSRYARCLSQRTSTTVPTCQAQGHQPVQLRQQRQQRQRPRPMRDRCGHPGEVASCGQSVYLARAPPPAAGAAPHLSHPRPRGHERTHRVMRLGCQGCTTCTNRRWWGAGCTDCLQLVPTATCSSMSRRAALGTQHHHCCPRWWPRHPERPQQRDLRRIKPMARRVCQWPVTRHTLCGRQLQTRRRLSVSLQETWPLPRELWTHWAGPQRHVLACLAPQRASMLQVYPARPQVDHRRPLAAWWASAAGNAAATRC